MKQAVVLGITGGLGREIAKMLLERGYNILGTSHSRQIEDEYDPKRVEIVSLDFADGKQIAKFCQRLESMEHIDFMTNTIGTWTINRFENVPFEAFKEDMDINVLNYIPILQKAIPKLKEGSEIIFILTEMVIGEPNYFLSSYVSSKYALLGLMKSLAGELKQKGVKVNAVSPGMMDTKFTENVHRIVKEKYIKESVNGRLVEPKEVALQMGEILDAKITGENFPVFGKRAV